MIADLTPFLLVLSRHGWDRAGKLDAKRISFRHAGTGEEATVAPGEIPFWAAQLDPSILPEPAGDDEWYAVWTPYGWAEVRSRSGRRETGATHDRQGYYLICPRMRDAQRAAQVLNLRDQAAAQRPVQLEMILA